MAQIAMQVSGHKLAFGVRDTVVIIRSGSGLAPGSRLYARCLYVSMYRAHNISPCRSIGSKPPSWSRLGSRREARGCDSDELRTGSAGQSPDSARVGHVVVRHATPKSVHSGTNSCAKFTMQWGRPAPAPWSQKSANRCSVAAVCSLLPSRVATRFSGSHPRGPKIINVSRVIRMLLRPSRMMRSTASFICGGSMRGRAHGPAKRCASHSSRAPQHPLPTVFRTHPSAPFLRSESSTRARPLALAMRRRRHRGEPRTAERCRLDQAVQPRNSPVGPGLRPNVARAIAAKGAADKCAIAGLGRPCPTPARTKRLPAFSIIACATDWRPRGASCPSGEHTRRSARAWKQRRGRARPAHGKHPTRLRGTVGP